MKAESLRTFAWLGGVDRIRTGDKGFAGPWIRAPEIRMYSPVTLPTAEARGLLVSGHPANELRA
jgi:hypothetical protein